MRGAYIAQINRLIFVNNFLILAKGRSARLSRRRRRDFRPSRGNLPVARVRALRVWWRALTGSDETLDAAGRPFQPSRSRLCQSAQYCGH
jgi:hypothetical protein